MTQNEVIGIIKQILTQWENKECTSSHALILIKLAMQSIES